MSETIANIDTNNREFRFSRDGSRVTVPRLMTPGEVAAFLQIDVQTVRRWCRSGRLRSTQFGRTHRIFAESIFSHAK